jgi:hypothetical protein
MSTVAPPTWPANAAHDRLTEPAILTPSEGWCDVIAIA